MINGIQRTFGVLFLFLMASPALAQQQPGNDKSAYDVILESNQDAEHVAKSPGGLNYLTLGGNAMEISLLDEGYFTIGTTSGESVSALDDSVQVTFGHPVALTSYPTLTIDGVVYRPDVYFYGASRTLEQIGDTLRLRTTSEQVVDMQFDMILLPGENAVSLELSLINTDAEAHEIAAGLLLDPALGKWGDGSLMVNEEEISSRTTYASDLPDQLDIWERSARGLSRGLGVQIDYDAGQPDLIEIGNWFDLHKNEQPTVDGLYDLTLRFGWDAVTLNPSESLTRAIRVSLLAPDFPEGLFLRANLPRFFSLEDNLLFPRNVHASVLMENNSISAENNVRLGLDLNDTFINEDDTQLYTVLPSEPTYGTVSFFMPESFEDQVATLRLSAVDVDLIFDQYEQKVFIPGIPLSDTGLSITVDSVITSNTSDLGIQFTVSEEETGRLIGQLRKENVFLYEDGVRLQDFNLSKSAASGVDEVDVVFVLDVTGSMGDEISDVKDNIIEFADSLSIQGIDYRLGMVTFLDKIENIYGFTGDAQAFQSIVATQFAHGGGDGPENSLDALMAATQFEFRPSANRIVVWITDSNYHIADSVTPLQIQPVIDALLGQGIQVHSIGNSSFQTTYYNPIVNATGGNFFDIFGNFRDILLNISRLELSGTYLLSFVPSTAPVLPETVSFEVHFAGLGGQASVNPGSGKILSSVDAHAGPANISAHSFPNPFSDEVRIRLKHTGKLGGYVEIFNMMGQRIRKMPITAGQEIVDVKWDATDQAGSPVSNGVYMARIQLEQPGGKVAASQSVMLVFVK